MSKTRERLAPIEPLIAALKSVVEREPTNAVAIVTALNRVLERIAERQQATIERLRVVEARRDMLQARLDYLLARGSHRLSKVSDDPDAA